VQTTSLNKKGLEAYIKGLGTVLNLTNYAQIIINMARNLLIFTHLIYNITIIAANFNSVLLKRHSLVLHTVSDNSNLIVTYVTLTYPIRSRPIDW
jgi:hypothetical protein